MKKQFGKITIMRSPIFFISWAVTLVIAILLIEPKVRVLYPAADRSLVLISLLAVGGVVSCLITLKWFFPKDDIPEVEIDKDSLSWSIGSYKKPWYSTYTIRFSEIKEVVWIGDKDMLVIKFDDTKFPINISRKNAKPVSEIIKERINGRIEGKKLVRGA